MSTVVSHDARQLLAAPLNNRDRQQVGDAVWLYLYVLAHGMRTGHLYRTREHLGRDLAIDDATLDQWLSALRMTDLIRVQASGDYLVLKPHLWPGRPSAASDLASANAAHPAQNAVQNNVPVGGSSSSKQQQAGSASKQGVDGGVGEGEGLAAQVQAVVGAQDLTELRTLLARHPESHIRDALARVERTPASQIRKSRYALFRYLLSQPQNPIHDSDQTNPA